MKNASRCGPVEDEHLCTEAAVLPLKSTKSTPVLYGSPSLPPPGTNG